MASLGETASLKRTEYFSGIRWPRTKQCVGGYVLKHNSREPKIQGGCSNNSFPIALLWSAESRPICPKSESLNSQWPKCASAQHSSPFWKRMGCPQIKSALVPKIITGLKDETYSKEKMVRCRVEMVLNPECWLGYKGASTQQVEKVCISRSDKRISQKVEMYLWQNLERKEWRRLRGNLNLRRHLEWTEKCLSPRWIKGITSKTIILVFLFWYICEMIFVNNNRQPLNNADSNCQNNKGVTVIE